ncbi:MAG: uroporphyrinogen decarboxylase family protein [Victivallaceae bacterium]
MQKMTGRQRALAAINNRKVDRIPGYTPTVACDVAGRILGREAFTGSPTLWYAQALAHCKGGSAFADFSEQIDRDLIELNRAMETDVLRYGYRRDIKPSKQLDEYSFLYGDIDGTYEIWAYNPEVMNFSRIETNAPARQPEDWPLLAQKAIAALPSELETIKANAGVWEEKMQKIIGDEMLIVSSGGGFSVGLDEGALMACILEPGAVSDILDCQLEMALACATANARRGQKVLLGGGDMADNNGTLYSPETFAELQMPRLKKFTAYAKSLGLHYCWRSDGKLWEVTDYLFKEAGIPGFGEIDFIAQMSAAGLREKYPELVLWANVAGDTLRRSTPEKVYEHAFEIMRGAGQTGHLYGCSNTILPGTPVENVYAMMQAADDYSATLK